MNYFKLVSSTDKNDLIQITKIHSEMLYSYSIMSKCGNKFLMSFYKTACCLPSTVLLSCRNVVGVQGYVLYTLESRNFINVVLNKMDLSSFINPIAFAYFVFRKFTSFVHPIEEPFCPAEIVFIAVEKKSHGKRIATKLLRKTFEYLKDNHIKELHLQVVKSNKAALKLYTKLSFKEVEQKSNKVILLKMIDEKEV